GLAQAEHGLFAQRAQGVGQAHAGGGLALAGGGGADGGDKDQLARLAARFGQAGVELGLVAAVGDDGGGVQAQARGGRGDGAEGGFLCDLDIGLHSVVLLCCKQKGQRCAANTAQGCPDGRLCVAPACTVVGSTFPVSRAGAPCNV